MPEQEKNKPSAADGLKRFALGTANGAKRLARITKLKMQVSDQKRNIERLYHEIGRLYYEVHRDDPGGFFVQPVQQLDASLEAVAAMEAELMSLREKDGTEEAPEPDITVEIEQEPEDAPAPKEPEAPAPTSQEPEAPVPEDAPAETE